VALDRSPGPGTTIGGAMHGIDLSPYVAFLGILVLFGPLAL
jgi:hypothetical protein